MQTHKEYATSLGDTTLTATFTDLADQATGSVIVSAGETVVLVTAVMSDETKDMPYFPLKVDYEERFYAAGQILGSRFMRREGRPSDEAVLSGRIIDRTIRPLFNQRMRFEVQVVVTVLSIGAYDPDSLAVIGASLALGTSSIPWNGPVSAVRVGQNDGALVINPSYESRSADTPLDLIACGKDGLINMVEVGAREVSEEKLVEALEYANGEIAKLQAFQETIIAERGAPKRDTAVPEPSEALIALFAKEIEPKLEGAIFGDTGKGGIKALEKEWRLVVAEQLEEADQYGADDYLEGAVDALIHRQALEGGKRADGRGLDEVRSLAAKAGGIAPRLHGSGVFYRGGTHVLSALTLGGPDDSQIVEGMEVQTKKRFFHHYNFPPFSTGEAGRVGGFNRRATGHGALAEKALEPVIPPQETFPYTIRIVSEAMASNGSTSMGSVCGSTIALMDGGVPITRPVAGIAMGLMSDADGAYKVLTDIQGPEDHYGDMDFKVAGTTEGVTAVQMDVKVAGVPVAILAEAFEGAKRARLQILDVITKEIPEPRPDISPNAPHIEVLTIDPEKIGMVIGAGGKVVNKIKEMTGAEISLEDDGTVYITGDAEGSAKAREYVSQIVHEYATGERYTGEVTRLMDFGAFVKIGWDTEGLVHISELAPFHVARVGDVVSVGEEVPIIVKEIDERGRINLSIKGADPDFAERKGVKPAPPGPPSPRNHGRREHNTNERRGGPGPRRGR